MFEKKSSVKISGFSTFLPGMLSGDMRVMILPDQDILLIGNDEERFVFSRYTNEGIFKESFSVDYIYGQLAGVTFFKGIFWLEFTDILAIYEEQYNIVKVGPDGVDHIFSVFRESYLHDLAYHSLFVNNGELFLNLIRHNRLHHFKVSGTVEELDVLEGGKWYLCGSNPLCMVGQTLELYDLDLNICNTIEHDYEIDELFADVSHSPSFIAVTLTDLSLEHTSLFVHHNDTQAVHVAFIENAVSDMGVSGGKIWLNPYGFHMQQDLGGCMIFDRFAWPMYVHLRTKGQTGNIGAYPPPYHRSEGVYAAAEGMTLVAESGRVLLFDFNCRAVQEINISHPDCVAVSEDGNMLVLLQLDKYAYVQEKPFKHESVNIDIHKWNSAYDGDKVIEMVRFRDKE